MSKNDELKKALIIGVLGSFLLKIIEWSFQLTKLSSDFLTQNSGIFNMPLWLYQLFSLIILSSLISLLVYNIKKNMFHIAFVPSVWYALKEIYNYFTNGIPFGYGLLESIVVGIPTGIAVYYVITKEKIKIKENIKKAVGIGLISTLWFFFVLWYAGEITVTSQTFILQMLSLFFMSIILSIFVFTIFKKLLYVSITPFLYTGILLVFNGLPIFLLYGLLFGTSIGITLYYLLGKGVIKLG